MVNSRYDKKTKEEKMNLIMNIAEKIFVEKGYQNATMTEIAKKVNIAKGTLYLYFSSKKDLYFTSVERALTTLKNLIIDNFKNCKNGFEKVVTMGKTYVFFSTEYPNYYKLILNYETLEFNFDDKDQHVKKTYERSQEIFELLVSCVKEGIKDGSIDKEFDPSKISMILWGEITGLVQQVNLRGKLYKKWTGLTPIQIYEYYIEVTKKMLMAN